MASEANLDAPPFWSWMGSQHLNVDPVRAEAAKHIRDRWAYNSWYDHAKVLRALQREDSEYLIGARLLADDYVEQFPMLDSETRIAAVGSSGTLYPFQPENCNHENTKGLTCGREAIPGTGRCARHGGQWITDKDRIELSKYLQIRMEESAARAIRVIEDLMDNARSEKVRLDAAVAVLDRSGMGTTSTLRIESDVTSPVVEIRERLEKLGNRVRDQIEHDARSALPPATGETVIGEVIPETAAEPIPRD